MREIISIYLTYLRWENVIDLCIFIQMYINKIYVDNNYYDLLFIQIYCKYL